MFEILRATLKYVFKPRYSYSQFGEDTLIQTLVHKDNGFYVDIGAYHPHLYSNTFTLYERGWHGIAIDPNPTTEKLFKWFRPRDTFIRTGVGEEGSGVYALYTDGAYNGFVNPNIPSRVRQIGAKETPIKPLSTLIPKGQRIDFLNIDVEGMDLEVLQTLDWSNPPTVIAVEGDGCDNFLKLRGYYKVKKLGETTIWKL